MSAAGSGRGLSPGNCCCRPRPDGDAPAEPDRFCPVHGEGRGLSRQEKIEKALRDSLVPCGNFDADGHDEYRSECPVCQEANSDAPEWTL